MKTTHSLFASTFCTLIAFTGASYAQTESPATLADVTTSVAVTPAATTPAPNRAYSLFSEEVYLVDSGFENRLDLTDEQRIQLKAAYEETVAPVLAQQNPSGTTDLSAAERRAYEVRLRQAQRELRQRQNAILTPEQQVTLRRIDSVVRSVSEEVDRVYAARLDAANDEQRELLLQERSAMIAAVVTSRLRQQPARPSLVDAPATGDWFVQPSSVVLPTEAISKDEPTP